ncbi:MAG: hypothetical protein ABIR17_02210 [Pseudolysinimonas sp.]|uniref:hypothetical protein n=1 Tax=Pseudolysinimonas sp. TaxID=2680009 RepID=UPI003266E4F9
MTRRSPVRTALTIGALAVLAAGVVAGAAAVMLRPSPIAVDDTVTRAYVASSGEIWYLRLTAFVNDHRESSSLVARRYLRTADLQTLNGAAAAGITPAGLGGTQSATSVEIASVLELLRDGATNAVHKSGSPNAQVFVAETHECQPPPPIYQDDPRPTAADLAGRPFGNWSVTPPDFEGFRITASGEVCEIHVTVFFAVSDPAVLARARAYLAGLDLSTIDVSADLADWGTEPGAFAPYPRARLEADLIGLRVLQILSDYLDAQGLPGVVNGGDAPTRCDND